ncbi:ankyrin repeat domain-containing protein [Wolbachia endosymbiont of Pentidionis agamae]|uniref:ankyrin repeat domain-containing protein n=1 Tax=Wolbachia endosymbiont of Pentidionis agamae TaxID=3110435 RepID=UPI002FD5A1DF
MDKLELNHKLRKAIFEAGHLVPSDSEREKYMKEIVSLSKEAGERGYYDLIDPLVIEFLMEIAIHLDGSSEDQDIKELIKRATKENNSINNAIKMTSLDEKLLHKSAQSGNVKAMKFLIEDCGANVNIKTSNGVTPLHVTALNGYTDATVLLLSKGADPYAEIEEVITVQILDLFCKNKEKFWNMYGGVEIAASISMINCTPLSVTSDTEICKKFIRRFALDKDKGSLSHTEYQRLIDPRRSIHNYEKNEEEYLSEEAQLDNEERLKCREATEKRKKSFSDISKEVEADIQRRKTNLGNLLNKSTKFRHIESGENMMEKLSPDCLNLIYDKLSYHDLLNIINASCEEGKLSSKLSNISIEQQSEGKNCVI